MARQQPPAGRHPRPATTLTLALISLLVIPVAASAAERRIPKVLWAQRRSLLYLRVVIPSLERNSLRVTLNDTHVRVSGTSTEEGAQYAMTAHLFRKIEPAGSSWEVNDLGEVQFIIQKFWEWRYWPRMLKEYKQDSPLQKNLQVDWKRWKPEFDEMSNDDEDDMLMPGEDSNWLDDEVALRKPAIFPTEDFNRQHMPLIDESGFRSFLEMKGRPQQLSVVLFFERTYNKKSSAHQQLFRLFAATSSIVHRKVQVGSVDAKANQKLMRKLRLTQFPTAKLFFPNGDMFEFNPAEMTTVKNFGMFLFRQLNPPWVDIQNVDMFARVFEQAQRVVLGVFDEEEQIPEEKVANLAAKTYRAMPSPPPVVFSRLNTSLLPDIYDASSNNSTIASILDSITMRELVSQGFRGVVMVKRNEDPIPYNGPLKKDPLMGWIYAKHFNVLEEITRGNFNEFRRRNLPVLYILLDEDMSTHKKLLADVKMLAQEYEGRVSFVYTRVSTSGDLMDHLRCEYQGITFAVMEDFVNEYRYCADATPTKPLSIDRLRRLTEGVLANSLKPDKVASQKIPDPKDNLGPVFDVVADNLMETVMDMEHDVVVHFYAEFDEKWDDDEFELAKLGDAAEDIPKLKITRINGILNEKPAEFPEIGYIPCTWMFPMNNKYSPVYFNKTIGGFNAHRLLQWVKQTASIVVDVPDIPDPLAPVRSESEITDEKLAGREKERDAEAATGEETKAQKTEKAAKKPKSKDKAKLDDVMKELNEMRKEIKGRKKDEL